MLLFLLFQIFGSEHFSLEKGVVTNHVLKSKTDEIHHRVYLNAGEHIEIHFEQVSIILFVTVLDPQKNVVKEVAPTNASYGPFIVSFDANKPGEYLVVCTPYWQWKEGFDSYRVKVLKKMSKEEYLGYLDGLKSSPEVLDLRKNAHSLESLDFQKQEDITFLKDVIGDSRIVMLGEQTHMDGDTLKAKSKIIHYLKNEMGFNILAIESGLYEVHRLVSDFRAEKHCVRWSDAIYNTWTKTNEFTPIINLYNESKNTSQPFDIWGFDNQFYGPYAMGFWDDLENLALANNVEVHKDHKNSYVIFENIFNYNYLHSRVPRPSDLDVQHFFDIIDYYVRSFEPLTLKASTLDLRVMVQSLKSFKTHAESRLLIDLPVSQNDYRDAQMGKNLIWLANEFPDQKIIVWSATAHILHDLHEMTRLPNTHSLKTTKMGDHIYDTFGDDMYSIAFTAYSGEYGREWSQNKLSERRKLSRKINPNLSPMFELEEMFHHAGFKYAFLDLKNNKSVWLEKPLVARLAGHFAYEAKWKRCIDAIFFIDEMHPGTLAGDR